MICRRSSCRSCSRRSPWGGDGDPRLRIAMRGMRTGPWWQPRPQLTALTSTCSTASWTAGTWCCPRFAAAAVAAAAEMSIGSGGVAVVAAAVAAAAGSGGKAGAAETSSRRRRNRGWGPRNFRSCHFCAGSREPSTSADGLHRSPFRPATSFATSFTTSFVVKKFEMLQIKLLSLIFPNYALTSIFAPCMSRLTFLLTLYAAMGNQSHVSSVAPLLRDLYPGCFTAAMAQLLS